MRMSFPREADQDSQEMSMELAAITKTLQGILSLPELIQLLAGVSLPISDVVTKLDCIEISIGSYLAILWSHRGQGRELLPELMFQLVINGITTMKEEEELTHQSWPHQTLCTPSFGSSSRSAISSQAPTL